jgi:hypothetical protein
VIVKLSAVEPFIGRVAAPNAFAITGGPATVTFAEAVLPVPPFVELTAPVVLVYVPDTAPVTFTRTAQVVLTPTVPPVNVTLPEPATAVAVPPHVLVNPFGVATNKLAGKVSVIARPTSGTGCRQDSRW